MTPRPAFRLETDRLILRPFREEDLPAFIDYRSDPEVARYQSWTEPYPESHARAFLAAMDQTDPFDPDGWYQVAMELKASGEMIGDCAYCIEKINTKEAEIGFTLARAHQSRGYAIEGVRRLLDFLFEQLGMESVSAICDAENTPSCRLLERVGFIQSRPPERVPFKGGWSTERFYSLTPP